MSAKFEIRRLKARKAKGQDVDPSAKDQFQFVLATKKEAIFKGKRVGTKGAAENAALKFADTVASAAKAGFVDLTQKEEKAKKSPKKKAAKKAAKKVKKKAAPAADDDNSEEE